MSGAVILAIVGTTAAALSMLGGWLTPRYPVTGPRLVGCAGAVMLVGNLIVIAMWR